MAAGVSGSGVLVGGEPTALLAASSTLYEVAARTDDVGRRLAAALGPAVSTVAAAAPYAPQRAAAVAQALSAVLSSPAAGLLSVFAAYEALSLQLRGAGQALEAAGAVGLLASGGLRLLRGGRPTVLASADGVDLRREVVTGSWSLGPGGAASSLGVREVRRPDGSTIFVVEVARAAKQSGSAGVQVNGFGAYAEGAAGTEEVQRWAVPTRHDAEMLLALVSTSLVAGAGVLARSRLPAPTETTLATTASGAATGGVGPPLATSTSGLVAARSEVTLLGGGGQRFATTLGSSGQVALSGVAGTGGAGSVRVTVERNAGGAVTKAAVGTTTEVDRGRHGLPLVEAGNREATLVERDLEVDLTPERRAAADRVALAVARGDAPDRADVAVLTDAARAGQGTERTYDVRHQQASADVGVAPVSAGAGAGIDTAVLRPT